MHKNAPFCTDACNTPVYYTPVSVHPKKRGGWKPSRMTPLLKRGFGPPLIRYVFHPAQVPLLCFSCTKIQDGADQKLFWRGPKELRESAFSGTFSSPIRFAPPHITAQFFFRGDKAININTMGGTVSRTNRNYPWDKRDPSLGQTGTRPCDKPAVFLFTSTAKIAILSRSSLGRVPVCPWNDCPARAVRKCLCLLCLLFFFRHQKNPDNPYPLNSGG